MAKILFDIKYRPQIESGEYKVETRSGKTARVVCWDRAGTHLVVLVGKDEDVLTYNPDGTTVQQKLLPSDLFIVTPEEEMTEFEKAFLERVFHQKPEDLDEENREIFQKDARDVLALAEKEAIDARAKELYEGLKQSKLDKDSIPYHLIEFMCNLYTCPNWKEIEETAELYVTRLKAAALKDLPRWKKWGNGVCGNGSGIPLALVVQGLNCYELADVLCIQGEKYIMLSDLEKLPGFKEDRSHE